VKTTVDIDDVVLAKAKALAAREQTSLTSVIEQGLRLRLRQQPPAQRPISIHPGTGGLAAGIDSVSNRSLLDAADDDARS